MSTPQQAGHHVDMSTVWLIVTIVGSGASINITMFLCVRHLVHQTRRLTRRVDALALLLQASQPPPNPPNSNTPSKRPARQPRPRASPIRRKNLTLLQEEEWPDPGPQSARMAQSA